MLMAFAAAAPAAPHPAQGTTGASNWLTVVDTARAAAIARQPAAKVRLTEFVSYTCPHCGHFAQESRHALRLAYVSQGKVQVEVRHVIRDPVDLTAAMLANCGPAAKFPRNHAALFAAQPQWLAVVARATPAQRTRWSNGPVRRAPARDRQRLGVLRDDGDARLQRVALDRCLTDEVLARRLAEQSAADDTKWQVSSTPSFAIDGTLLAGTHAWSVLQPQLDARL